MADDTHCFSIPTQAKTTRRRLCPGMIYMSALVQTRYACDSVEEGRGEWNKLGDKTRGHEERRGQGRSAALCRFEHGEQALERRAVESAAPLERGRELVAATNDTDATKSERRKRVFDATRERAKDE
jgi:hypothetical protein